MVYGIQAYFVERESDDAIRDFIRQAGGTYPVFVDVDDTYHRYDRVGATSPFPLEVVVDKNGIIRHSTTRFEADELEAVITSLLAE